MFALGQLYTGIKRIWPHIYVTDLLARYCCPLVTCLSSILFKNRWWCLFHRRRRVKTVRSNQIKHLKSGINRIKSQQSCLISTVVASQRLPTWQQQDEDCSSSPPHCSCCSCRSHVCRRLWRRGGATWWILRIVLLFVRISTTWHWAGLTSLGTLEKILRWRHTWLFLDVVLVET